MNTSPILGVLRGKLNRRQTKLGYPYSNLSNLEDLVVYPGLGQVIREPVGGIWSWIFVRAPGALEGKCETTPRVCQTTECPMGVGSSIERCRSLWVGQNGHYAVYGLSRVRAVFTHVAPTPQQMCRTCHRHLWLPWFPFKTKKHLETIPFSRRFEIMVETIRNCVFVFEGESSQTRAL